MLYSQCIHSFMGGGGFGGGGRGTSGQCKGNVKLTHVKYLCGGWGRGDSGWCKRDVNAWFFMTQIT